MSSSQQLLEDAFAIVGKANGYLAKLYLYKSSLLKDLEDAAGNPKHRLYFLKDPELLKLRGKIEKKFPALPDVNKVSSFEIYRFAFIQLRSCRYLVLIFTSPILKLLLESYFLIINYSLMSWTFFVASELF